MNTIKVKVISTRIDFAVVLVSDGIPKLVQHTNEYNGKLSDGKLLKTLRNDGYHSVTIINKEYVTTLYDVPMALILEHGTLIKNQ